MISKVNWNSNFTHFHTFPKILKNFLNSKKIPEKDQKFQPRDKIPALRALWIISDLSSVATLLLLKSIRFYDKKH